MSQSGKQTRTQELQLLRKKRGCFPCTHHATTCTHRILGLSPLEKKGPGGYAYTGSPKDRAWESTRTLSGGMTTYSRLSGRHASVSFAYGRQ